jgi:hypothetical protein
VSAVLTPLSMLYTGCACTALHSMMHSTILGDPLTRGPLPWHHWHYGKSVSGVIPAFISACHQQGQCVLGIHCSRPYNRFGGLQLGRRVVGEFICRFYSVFRLHFRQPIRLQMRFNVWYIIQASRRHGNLGRYWANSESCICTLQSAVLQLELQLTKSCTLLFNVEIRNLNSLARQSFWKYFTLVEWFKYFVLRL